LPSCAALKGGGREAWALGTTRGASSASLLCWLVVAAGTWEEDALPRVVRHTLSACNAHKVLSNASSLVGGSVSALQFWHGSMQVKRGGLYGTALNTPIFVARLG